MKQPEDLSKVVTIHSVGEVNVRKIEFSDFSMSDISFIKYNFLPEKDRNKIIGITISIITEK